jgi:methylaspartate ammonia-lyase
MHTEDGFLYYGEVAILSFQVVKQKYEKCSLQLENK